MYSAPEQSHSLCIIIKYCICISYNTSCVLVKITLITLTFKGAKIWWWDAAKH